MELIEDKSVTTSVLPSSDDPLDALYLERNKCVSLLLRLGLALGLRAGLGQDKSLAPPWGAVAFLDLPSGQVSWHLHERDLPFFHDLPPYEGEWDRHSTEEKYRRVLAPGLEALLTAFSTHPHPRPAFPEWYAQLVKEEEELAKCRAFLHAFLATPF